MPRYKGAPKRADMHPGGGLLVRDDDSVLDATLTLENILARLVQVVTNTGGENSVNIETIMQDVLAACEAILANSNTSIDVQVAIRDLTEQIRNSSAAGATDLAAIEAINTDIRTAIQILDNVVGTHDAAVPTQVSMQGQYAESTTPAAVADGDAVRPWFDPYGRQIPHGANLAQASQDTSDVAPAIMQVLENAFAQLTAPGSTPAVNTQDYHYITFQVLLDIGGCTNVVIRADGSMDLTNWAPLGVVDDDNLVTACAVANEELTITANGTYYLRIRVLKTRYVRFTFVSELDDTDAVLDVVAMAGN